MTWDGRAPGNELDLSNAPATGDTLVWNGTAWIPKDTAYSTSVPVPAVAAGAIGAGIAVTFPVGMFSSSPGVSVTSNIPRLTLAISGLGAGGMTVTPANWSGAASAAGTIYVVAIGT